MIKEKRPEQIGHSGFTIVETLIVLAVTGVMFAAIATVISGRQRSTEFSQAIQNVKSQVQQVINEVNTGTYPANDHSYSCSVNVATGVLVITPGDDGIDQGSNQGCIFIGKVLHFNNSTEPEPFYAYAVAAKQIDSSGDPVDTITNAAPQVLADGAHTFDNQIDNFTLEYGLRVKYICYGDCVPATGGFSPINSSQTGSLAFVSLSGNPSDSSQSVNLLPISNASGGTSSLSNPTGAEATQINNFFKTGPLASLTNPTDGAHICFVGGNGDSAIMNIGDSGDALSVTVDIKENATCT